MARADRRADEPRVGVDDDVYRHRFQQWNVRRLRNKRVDKTAAAQRRYAVYQQLAGITVPVIQPADEEPAKADSKEE